ncbi:unnamed protein product [Lactuca saligna]|uniref:RING-type domain-containing protein n=1 Tax=Lactuca saligna TaxID=75948 RepID=A0AA35ZSV1_LACSI|nr:unnamed protein product [Lactuca saligna]
MEKLGEGSCGDKHGGKDDSKTSKKRSVYNLRSKDPKPEGSMGPPTYNLRNKVQKTEGKKASKVTQNKKTPKKNGSKDSSPIIQRRVVSETELKRTYPKIPPFPSTDIGSKKPLTTSMADHDKNQPSSSQLEPFFHDPVYHIRWEGYELGSGHCGQICVLCNKDLSSSIESDSEDDEESEYNEDSLYGDDDDDGGGDYGYFDERAPPLLPIVDILACGHAFHTECLKNGAHDEESADPICVLCSRMA